MWNRGDDHSHPRVQECEDGKRTHAAPFEMNGNVIPILLLGPVGERTVGFSF